LKMVNLITNHIDIWTTAQTKKSNGGKGRGKNSNEQNSYGIKKLRELILELAIRGKLVPQDPKDEPASVLLKNIAKEKEQLIKEGKIKKQKALPQVSENEGLFEMPIGWKWTRLGSISQINPRNEAEDNLTVSFVPMPLISASHTGEHGQEIRTWGEVKKGYTHFADGDIGIAKITPCFENSKAAVFRRLENGIGAGTTELHIARPFGSTLDPRYILLFLKAPRFLYVGKTKMTGTAGQKRVPKDFFSKTPLPLPPLAEQHRIVSKVDELMVLCDKLEQEQTDSNENHQVLVETLLSTLANAANQRKFTKASQRIANYFDTLFTTEQSLDQLKQSVLQLAAIGKLVSQNPNDEPASVLLEKIAKEKARLIEEEGLRTKAKTQIDPDEEYINRQPGWEYCRLGNLAKFIDYRGRTPRKTEFGVPLITAKNVRFGHISRDPQEFISEDEYDIWMTRGFPRVGDILFTTEAPLGNVAIVDIQEKFALAQRVICFQLHDPNIAPFLRILIMSQSFQRQLIDKATGMTATGIKSAKLKEIPVPIPPLAEQHRIVAKVDELMFISDDLKDRLTDIQTTKVQLADSIVNQAVS